MKTKVAYTNGGSYIANEHLVIHEDSNRSHILDGKPWYHDDIPPEYRSKVEKTRDEANQYYNHQVKIPLSVAEKHAPLKDILVDARRVSEQHEKLKERSMKKIAFTGNPEEDLYRTLTQHISRETVRAEADAMFEGAAENRKKDRSALEKLFIQTPAAQVSPNLLKESAVFGAGEPGVIEHAAVPYKHRKDAYTGYLKEKSKEKETGYGKGGGVGATVGGLLGGIAGLASTKSLKGAAGGAALGAAGGGAVGLALAAADKGNIAEAKDILKSGKIDSHLAQRISARIEDRESRKQMHEAIRHAQTLSEIRRSREDRGSPSEVHHYHHEKEKKPAGKCTNCGAPAPTSGGKCEYCKREEFTKTSSIAPNVDAFFEKLSAAMGPDEAQQRYPELLKVAQQPAPNLKVRPKTTGAVRSDMSGGSA